MCVCVCHERICVCECVCVFAVPSAHVVIYKVVGVCKVGVLCVLSVAWVCERRLDVCLRWWTGSASASFAP